MKIFINFANEKFANQQKFALFTARLFGNFDKIIGYIPDDIDRAFAEKNKRILSETRGAGLWLWKPYFILRTLQEAKDGDYIFYLDSGIFMTKKIDLLIRALEKSGQSIMPFETYYPEIQWNKKSFLQKMGCDNDQYKKSNQFMSGLILIKNCDDSRRFFSDFLNLALVYENLSDALPGEEQYDDFIEHRHDQSIYSYLCKKTGLVSFRSAFVFGELGASYAVMKKTSLAYGRDLTFNFTEFKNSDYPTMLQVNKSFKFFGFNLNIYFIPYLYFKIMNIIPFKSRLYNFLLKLGTQGL